MKHGVARIPEAGLGNMGRTSGRPIAVASGGTADAPEQPHEPAGWKPALPFRTHAEGRLVREEGALLS